MSEALFGVMSIGLYLAWRFVRCLLMAALTLTIVLLFMALVWRAFVLFSHYVAFPLFHSGIPQRVLGWLFGADL